mgnify:CR=1 FL=1
MKKYVQRAETISCGSCTLDAQVGKYVRCADVISCGSRTFEAQVEKYLLRGAVKNSCGTFMRRERA